VNSHPPDHARPAASLAPYVWRTSREGKVYCCVMLDAYSRRVVGWSIDASPTAALVTSAVGMATGLPPPQPGALIHSVTSSRQSESGSAAAVACEARGGRRRW